MQIQPKVVDAGHHQRRLLRLTGLDVQDNQARRLLNDLDSTGRPPTSRTRTRRSSPTSGCSSASSRWCGPIPKDLRAKLEPAEVFHEVLEHRWYLAEQRQHDVPLTEAVDSYLANVLPLKPDEASVLGVDTAALPVIAREDLTPYAASLARWPRERGDHLVHWPASLVNVAISSFTRRANLANGMRAS